MLDFFCFRLYLTNAPVAQRIERLPPEQKVAGSIPAGRVYLKTDSRLMILKGDTNEKNYFDFSDFSFLNLCSKW